MRTNHEGSSWQAQWQRRGSINVVSFNTSSKSKKNWNGKQIQFSIHYFITLGKDSDEHTLPHLASWSTNEVTPPAPTQNHHKNIHSMSSYHLISQNALGVILHLERGGENLFWTWGGMFKQSVNMPWKHKSWGAKARRQKDDKKELMKQSKKFSDPASLWSLWNIRLFAFMPCSANKSRKAREPNCRFSEGFRVYGKVKSTCNVLLLV